MNRELELAGTIEDLRRRLAEAEQTLLAFTRGEIDAVVDGALATPLLLRQAQDELRGREQLLRAIFDGVGDGILLVDSDGACLDANPAACSLFGVTKSQLLGQRIEDFFAAGFDAGAKRVEFAGAAPSRGVVQISLPDGSLRELEYSETRNISPKLHLAVLRDLSERNRLEAQLAQARKMEAIGVLAGGIAHDFNNLLSIMVTYAAFALEVLQPGDALRSDIEQIAQAGERATALTHQLLAFSRQQILEPKIIDLNSTIGGLESMLRRLLGEGIEIVLIGEPLLGRVSADPGQIEQVIMNLVVNARDAMPDGGELTIETANVAAAEAPDGAPSLKPTAYVRLSVSDTGSGMDAATREHIFEPFFTTKELGKGTGLGLSTVLGIIQQSDGCLEVRSVLGKGTTFDAFLPRVDRPVSIPVAAPVSAVPIGGSETVLLVEDDEQVRTLCRSILRRSGYEVLAAANAGEAFLISEQHSGRIHLLLTDVMMPRMNGRQLAERVAITRPEMKVLFMTGYTDDAEVRQAALHADVALLHKPITPLGLARRVRSLLDAAPPSARDIS